MIGFKKWSASLALLAVAGVAHAIPTYDYNDDNPHLGGNLGSTQLFNINTSYDDNNAQFSYEYTITDTNKQKKNNDGFWLVVNDSANPKGNTNLAILYGDLDNDRLTAYKYDGVNGYSSYTKAGAFIESWNNVFTQTSTTPGTKTVSFDINVLAVNSVMGGTWQGVSYADSIGIWFHPTVNSKFKYANNGGINKFKPGSSGWHDIGHQATSPSPVSAPSVFLLLGAGLAAFGVATRRRNKREATAA